MTLRGRIFARILAAIIAVLLMSGGNVMAATPKKTHPSASKSSGSPVKTYRWIDDDGVVHFGDQIPPEYASKDRLVLNRQGVAVQTEQGTITAAEEAAERQAAAEKAAGEASARRDSVLLTTYLSIEEIEALRDRRVELIGGQIRVTENYLANLKKRLQSLQQEASAYKPYSSDPKAQPIDENLAQELSDTVDSIALYEKTLLDTRHRQNRLVAEFANDIARFRELKQLDEVQP